MTIHHHSVSHHHEPTIKDYLLATRPVFLVASLLPVLYGSIVGFQIADRQNGNFDFLALLLALVAVAFVNLGINVLNDVYDDINGTDRINRHAVIPFTGGSRAIQDNVLTREQMRHWSYLLLTLSVVTGFFLFLHNGYGVIVFGLLGLFLGIGYSMPPVKLASRGLGEAAIALGVGMLPVMGAAWLQSDYFSWAVLWLSLPIGLWVTNIILVNEVPDAEADSTSGKNTLAVRFGVKATAGFYLILNMVAAASIVIAALFGLIPFMATVLPIVLLVPSVLTTKKIRLWQQQRDAFVAGIKFNIASYLLNIVWVMAWTIIA